MLFYIYPVSFFRYKHWEYYPWRLANIPVYAYWLWHAAKARHLFFFSNVNPAIPLGGAFGESKWDILRALPPAIVPKMILVHSGDSFEEVTERLCRAGIEFPLIAKPDVGERGFLVKKIERKEALHDHLSRWPVRFILQEFLELPVEASVLYHFAGSSSSSFSITSVCVKVFLTVNGDGSSTIRELMSREFRALLQLPRFERDFPELLDKVPSAGEEVLLEPVGNHARGTKFLNGNHLIGEEMLRSFEPICSQITGVRYARFDLKCASLKALQRGEFKVMELNGVLGEPAHIYDPSHGMLRAYRDLWRHWRIIYRLHCEQKRLGFQPTRHKEAWRMMREYFRYKKRVGR